jgi:tetratricopeptide (TPR) repeat protein
MSQQQHVAWVENEANLDKTEKLADEVKQNPTPEVRQQYQDQVTQTTAFADQTAAQYSDSPPMQAVTAIVSAQLGDTKTALIRAERGIKLAQDQKVPPDELCEILKIRAVAYAEARDYAKANADAKRILALFPKDEVAQKIEMLTRDRSMGSFTVHVGMPPPEPIQVLIDTVRPRAVNRPEGFNSSVGHTKDAETDLKLGDYQKMYDEATNAINRLPDNPKAYMQRAFAALMLKNYEQVITDAGAGLKLKPGAASLLGLRAAAYNETNQPQKALDDAANAVLDNPKDPFSWLQKGLAREKIGEGNDEYVDDIKTAADLDPNFEHYYLEALSRRGQGTSTTAPASSPAGGRGRWFVPAAMLAALLIIGVAFFAGRRGVAGGTSLKDEALLAGQYRIVREVGRGGMGVVYEAWDTKLERSVAIKKLMEGVNAQPEESRRLLKEARTVAALKHDNIVVIHNVFEEGGEVYCVFELVAGETLQDLIESRGRLTPEECLKYLMPICAALDYAHGCRLIHRDLKPSNIMLEKGKVKIMDFGIARTMTGGKSHTVSGLLAGTPAFMAPELLMGAVSPESDLYALGVSAYQMLSGRLPFEGQGMQQDKMEARFAPVSTYVKDKPGLDGFFTKALSGDREKRFRAAGDFLSAFRRALG